MDGHEAFLQAAGGQAGRVAELIEGRARRESPIERALVDLARKTSEQPKHLGPADLDPLRSLVGDGAIDYTLVVGGFHFINRIADLLHVDPEALPEPLRRLEPLRRMMVWASSRMMRRMDLGNRRYPQTFEQALQAARAGFEDMDAGALADAFGPVRSRPKIVEAMRHAIEERDQRSMLDRATIASIHAAVEDALPASRADVEGFHPRPADPVAAFAFVGTRYAARTTEQMIARLREAGYDDLGVLDLAIAVADANQWARMHRLLGLPAEIFYLEASGLPAQATA